MTEQENLGRAQELKREAEQWVDREFNFIQLEVFEVVAAHEGTILIEQIQPEDEEALIEDFVAEYSAEVNEKAIEFFKSSELEEDEANQRWSEIEPLFQEWFEENRDEFILNEMSEFEDFRHEREDENYPMWNTLFEFRSEPPAEWIEKAKASGFGVIDSFGPFNTTLFVSGAGYSFYGQHWIPLYMRTIHGVAEKYAGVDYSRD